MSILNMKNKQLKKNHSSTNAFSQAYELSQAVAKTLSQKFFSFKVLIKCELWENCPFIIMW